MKPKSSPQRKQTKPSGEAREKYRDYNPMPISPLTKQFEPTPAEPVRQHQRMAGC
jgi:hypothetical protein